MYYKYIKKIVASPLPGTSGLGSCGPGNPRAEREDYQVIKKFFLTSLRLANGERQLFLLVICLVFLTFFFVIINNKKYNITMGGEALHS